MEVRALFFMLRDQLLKKGTLITIKVKNRLAKGVVHKQ